MEGSDNRVGKDDYKGVVLKEKKKLLVQSIVLMVISVAFAGTFLALLLGVGQPNQV